MKIWISFFIAVVFIMGIARADDLAKQLEDHFQLYLIKPEKRSAADKITVRKEGNGDTATIGYWENLSKRKADEAICDAYQYLLLGRTVYGKGAKEAFEKFPSLQKIELGFYDIDMSTRKGNKRAEILPDQKIFEYLKISVVRDSFMKKPFNRDDVQNMIKNHQCVEVGKNFIDSVSINQDYLKAKK